MPIEDPQPWRGWHYLDEARGVETFHLLKAAVTEALAIPAGGRAIDVGCGTGDDVATFAGSADGAFAVGIDKDCFVLAEANRRWTHTGAAFAVADAHHLPILSGCMHGCRSERTLQHVADPAAVVAELARVLRPGGRLALTEPDWETCIVGGATPSLSRAVVANWLGRNRHPTVGRQLTGMVVRQGMTVAHLDGRAVCYRELDAANRVFPLRRAGTQAAADGLITVADLARWTSELTDASTKGEFLLSVTLFTVVATK